MVGTGSGAGTRTVPTRADLRLEREGREGGAPCSTRGSLRSTTPLSMAVQLKEPSSACLAMYLEEYLHCFTMIVCLRFSSADSISVWKVFALALIWLKPT